ncbi:hypothetical protein ACGFIP_10780 [Micromonospora zamorensis]|uniref:hypothetical protein n=1 Tax=Micromonospora zamorensis TaxID=709883 RepID=UPI00371411CD
MFGDIAERGEMLGGVVTYHQADSRRRDFHKLDHPVALSRSGSLLRALRLGLFRSSRR